MSNVNAIEVLKSCEAFLEGHFLLSSGRHSSADGTLSGKGHSELGKQLGKRAIFTERVDNVMTLKRFSINPGEKCVIAEDVVTTGISSLETKRVIEEAGGICLGITCVKLDLPNYMPEECPICAEGKLPLVHLGSRKMKEKAVQSING